MYTAIFTDESTTLLIETAEDLYLLQMGEEAPIPLHSGTNRIDVGAGVFKIVSELDVTITTHTNNIEVSTIKDKNGDWPDPKRAQQHVNRAALGKFFADAKGFDVRASTSKSS